jgi:hypothetical protein
VSIESRLQKLCEKIHPFRDKNCLIKTMEDRYHQTKEYKRIWGEIKDKSWNQQYDHVEGLWEKYQN